MLDMTVCNTMECSPSCYFLYKPSMILQPSHFQANTGLHIPWRDRAPGELPENMLQNLFLNLLPQTVLSGPNCTLSIVAGGYWDATIKSCVSRGLATYEARAFGEHNRSGKIPNEFLTLLTRTQSEIENTRVVVVKRMCEKDGGNRTNGRWLEVEKCRVGLVEIKPTITFGASWVQKISLGQD